VTGPRARIGASCVNAVVRQLEVTTPKYIECLEVGNYRYVRPGATRGTALAPQHRIEVFDDELIDTCTVSVDIDSRMFLASSIRLLVFRGYPYVVQLRSGGEADAAIDCHARGNLQSQVSDHCPGADDQLEPRRRIAPRLPDRTAVEIDYVTRRDQDPRWNQEKPTLRKPDICGSRRIEYPLEHIGVIPAVAGVGDPFHGGDRGTSNTRQSRKLLPQQRHAPYNADRYHDPGEQGG
jgi:hypothetical protein